MTYQTRKKWKLMENFDEQFRQRKADADQKAAELVRALTKAGRQEELFRASSDAQYRELLYREFNL